MDSYPARESYFALKYIRRLIKACVANSEGQTAFILLATVVSTEDASHYRRGVNFWDSQLLPLIGVSTWRALDKARSACVEAGLLHYERGNRKAPAVYWVLENAMLQGLDDSPTDESDLLRAEQVNDDESLARRASSAQQYPARKASSAQVIEQVARSTSIPVPVPVPPSPVPPPPKRAAPPKGDLPEPEKIELPESLQTDDFRNAWLAWCQHRREIRKKLTPTAVRQQLCDFVKMGPIRAAAAIRNSIAGGYQGIFEPKGQQNGNGTGTFGQNPQQRLGRHDDPTQDAAIAAVYARCGYDPPT